MPVLENPLKLRWGFRSIGEFIGTDERKAEYLVTSGFLPGAKFGGRWCSSETILTEHLEGRLRTCATRNEAKLPGPDIQKGSVRGKRRRRVLTQEAPPIDA